MGCVTSPWVIEGSIGAGLFECLYDILKHKYTVYKN